MKNKIVLSVIEKDGKIRRSVMPNSEEEAIKLIKTFINNTGEVFTKNTKMLMIDHLDTICATFTKNKYENNQPNNP